MLRKLLLILATSFFAASLPVAAEHIITGDTCFAHIDSNLYVVGDQMPRFANEVFVGNINPAGYDVELRYPEFKALSNKEIRAIRELQKSGVVPSDAILDDSGIVVMPSAAPVGGLDLLQTMYISRKKGYLNVSFCPIVRHEGSWKRILSCQVMVAAKKADPARPHKAPAADERWTRNSVLANGKWVKISVKNEGIYQFTADDLKKMGFNDLTKVKVYGYGGRLQDEILQFPEIDETVLQTEAPDDLVEVPLYPTADGRILFWAEGTLKQNWTSMKKYEQQQNYYSSYSYYFLTENDAARLPLETVGQDIDPNYAHDVENVPALALLDPDAYSWYPGGRRLFDSYCFSTGLTHSYRLETPELNINASGTKSIEVCLGTGSPRETQLSVKLNDQSIGKASAPGYDAKIEVGRVTTTSLNTYLSYLSPTESNVFQFTANKDNKVRLDFIRINYPRLLKGGATPYSFCPQTRGAVNLIISEATASTHVWRIGQKGSPTAEIASSLDDEGRLIATAPSGMRRFVYFDEKLTYATPNYVGEVANQNLHADSNVDYVIIVPANGKLDAQAERLGQLHQQRDGLSYKVVRADQLYNEFSSGTPDANAYRRYLKMLYDRAGDDESAMPRYCLFMGKSYWDNRFITEEAQGKKFEDHLLAYENESLISVGTVYSYCSDDFFGFLDDGEGGSMADGRLDIALGRMVCADEADAKLLVDKVERYMNNENVGSWKNTVVMLADDGGETNEHMNDSERVTEAIQQSDSNLDIQKVYWDRYKWTPAATGYTYPQATARIRQLMSEGALIFNYAGHGSPNMISHYKLLQTGDFAESLSPNMSVWVLASCEIYPFDSGEDNLAEASLYVPDGGSIAFICATRGVYGVLNNPFHIRYSRALLTPKEDGSYRTFGEALALAKNQLVEAKIDNGVNKLKYICFGDPALRLALPTGRVVLDSINGRAISEMSGLEVLSAGSAARFSGHVCAVGSETEIDKTFEGNVSATIFDCLETITCKDNQGVSKVGPMVYDERSKTIFKGSTRAVEGKFEFTAFIPRDISYTNKPGRISFYAVNGDKTVEYNGASETFCLNGTADMAEPDVKGPEVIAYINSIDNPDYTITDENPVLIADISDDYGINNAGISLGHDIELVVDGNTAHCINLNSYFSYDFGSYQRGQLVYEMKGMERGQHTAQLRVWDVNNNITTTDVHFIVRSESAQGGKDGYVTATKNPATTNTRFITYFPADTDVEGLVVYEVYDTRGRCVFKQPVGVAEGSSNASFTWDLCGNDHQPLPAGIYFYRTVIQSSKGQLATDAQKLIITRQ